LFLTFWYKKRIFKSEEEKLNLIIERLERLQGQFEWEAKQNYHSEKRWPVHVNALDFQL
jgi:hypothetical protein